MAQSLLPAYMGPLRITALEEPLPVNVSHEPGDVALMFLGDAAGERDDPLGAIKARYASVSSEATEVKIVPEHPVIMDHVVRPLQEAKLCYVLGMPVACIAQAGLVGEMAAIWRFQMLRPEIDTRLEDDEVQKIMRGRSFDDLGQERRVDVLKLLDDLDDRTKQAFGELRALRRQYLHFMVNESRSSDDDAQRALQQANRLVTGALDTSFSDGMVVLPDKVLRYIKDILRPCDTP